MGKTTLFGTVWLKSMCFMEKTVPFTGHLKPKFGEETVGRLMN
jgi:hypothetical protein